LRPGFLLSALLLAGPALAQDAKISLLSKQLSSASDPRTRAQAALLLGKLNSAKAVPSLCKGMQDNEAIVRSAVAGALGELKFPESIECLKAAKSDGDPTVRAAVLRSLEVLSPKPQGLVVAVEAVKDKVGSLSTDILQLTENLIREKLASMGATIAPALDAKAAAAAKNAPTGWQLQPALSSNGGTGLKLEILILSYPDLALRCQVKVGAKGGKPEAQLKALVPKAVSDGASECEWKQQ
jgi:HEAT repeat protein